MILRNGTKQIKGSTLWRGEPHFHPQMLFLLRRDFGFLPFDYIGDLREFEVAFKMILHEFSHFFHRNPQKYKKIVRHLRQREEGGTAQRYKRKKNYVRAVDKEYFITREQLSDADFRAICDVYWMDYLCLPFDVPEQCDIEAMFRKYYGEFIGYNDCYYS